jgi:hypothetical protein
VLWHPLSYIEWLLCPQSTIVFSWHILVYMHPGVHVANLWSRNITIKLFGLHSYVHNVYNIGTSWLWWWWYVYIYGQNSCLSRFPPSKIPCYIAKLSYCHPPQVFRHKSRKTNLNSPISTAHNYLLTAVYWSGVNSGAREGKSTLIIKGFDAFTSIAKLITVCFVIHVSNV